MSTTEKQIKLLKAANIAFLWGKKLFQQLSIIYLYHLSFAYYGSYIKEELVICRVNRLSFCHLMLTTKKTMGLL